MTGSSPSGSSEEVCHAEKSKGHAPGADGKDVDKTNMYLMRAEMRVHKLRDEGVKCPNCGRCGWILGYPLGSTTGFVKF